MHRNNPSDPFLGLSIRALSSSLDKLNSSILDGTEHPGDAANRAYKTYSKAVHLERFATGAKIKQLSREQFQNLVDPKAQSVWAYGDKDHSKEFTPQKTKINDDIWEHRHEILMMQFVGHESLDLAFKAAIQIVNSSQQNSDIKQIFHNAYEVYAKQRLFMNFVNNMGINTTLSLQGTELKWYDLTEKDLFLALQPETQNQLSKNGIHYES